MDQTSVSLNQRKSEFEKWIPANRPAIEKAALGLIFLRKIVSGCKEWPECDCWIYVFKLKHFVHLDYLYYYDKFDDRILRIPGAKFCHSVAHVHCFWQAL